MTTRNTTTTSKRRNETLKTKSKRYRRLSRHGAGILSALAVVGVVLTGILAAKAVPKAEEALEEAKEAKAMEIAKETGEEADFDAVELTLGEKVKACARPFWMALLAGGLTIGCVIGAQAINAATITAISTTLGTSTAIMKKYVAATKKEVGEEKEKEIRKQAYQEAAKDKLANDRRHRSGRAIQTGDGDDRFYDPWSDRFFYSSLDALRRHCIDFNDKISFGEFNERDNPDGTQTPSMNAWYDEIHLDETKSGEMIGWLIEPMFTSAKRTCVDYISIFADTQSIEYDGKLWQVVHFTKEPETIA